MVQKKLCKNFGRKNKMTSTQTISSSNLLGFKYVLGEDIVGLGMCMTDGHVYALMILRICEMAEPCYSKGNARPDSTNLTVRDTHLKNEGKRKCN